MQKNGESKCDKIFEQKQVRTYWDEEKEQWYFSVINVIEILTGSSIPKRIGLTLKRNLQQKEVKRTIKSYG